MPAKKASSKSSKSRKPTKKQGLQIGRALRKVVAAKTKKDRQAEKRTAAKAAAVAKHKAQAKRRKVFRHIVSRLKKLGIVDKKVDARKVNESDSKALRAKVRKYGTVALNNGRAIKAPKALRDKARKGGTEVFGNKIIVPTARGEHVRIEKGQVVKTAKGPGGTKIRTEVTLVRAKSVEDFIKNEKERLKSIEKKGNVSYAFRVWGNNSYAIFGSLSELTKYLEKYVKELEEDPDDLLGEGALEIVIVTGDPFDWREDAQKRRAARHERQHARNIKSAARHAAKREKLKGARETGRPYPPLAHPRDLRL